MLKFKFGNNYSAESTPLNSLEVGEHIYKINPFKQRITHTIGTYGGKK